MSYDVMAEYDDGVQVDRMLKGTVGNDRLGMEIYVYNMLYIHCIII